MHQRPCIAVRGIERLRLGCVVVGIVHIAPIEEPLRRHKERTRLVQASSPQTFRILSDFGFDVLAQARPLGELLDQKLNAVLIRDGELIVGIDIENLLEKPVGGEVSRSADQLVHFAEPIRDLHLLRVCER